MQHAENLHAYHYFQRFLALMKVRCPHTRPVAHAKPNLRPNVPNLRHDGPQLGSSSAQVGATLEATRIQLDKDFVQNVFCLTTRGNTQ